MSFGVECVLVSRVAVAALIGDLDGIAVVLRHHRLVLGRGDIGAFGLAGMMVATTLDLPVFDVFASSQLMS